MLSTLILAALSSASASYSVRILRKGATPAVSTLNAPGAGFSPCKFTFNPAWIPAAAPNLASTLIVRASGCPDAFGGGGDHLLLVPCSIDPVTGGSCGDVLPTQFAGFEGTAEDPRVFVYEGDTYLFYFAAGSGQSTVYLRKTATPLDASSWVHVAGPLAWHRNGCVIVRADGTHYVMFGESPPLPGLGLATTTDFTSFDVINATYMVPNGAGDAAAPEIVIEAGSTPVELTTGDYLHLYAAGTPGWVANGNCEGGRSASAQHRMPLNAPTPPSPSLRTPRRRHRRMDRHERRGPVGHRAAQHRAPFCADDGLRDRQWPVQCKSQQNHLHDVARAAARRHVRGRGCRVLQRVVRRRRRRRRVGLHRGHTGVKHVCPSLSL